MFDELHPLALTAATAGADAIRAIQLGDLAVQSKSGAEDLVTAADLASERAILEVIGRTRPADEIIAEESGAHPGTSGIRWYVDPLDGTANFVAGMTDYAVSIAARRGDVPVTAVIYRPADRRWLATTDDDGLHGTLHPAVSDRPRLSDVHLTVSRPHDPDRRGEAVQLRERLLPHVASERRVGSAACALLRVATGRLDAYVSVDLPLWDTAAGHRLVELAGGRVVTGALPTGTPVTIAAAPATAAALAALIAG